MSEIDTFVQFLKNLEYRWDALKKSENVEEKIFRAEFNELISLTLDASLDFRNVHQNSQIEEHWEKIKINISSLKQIEGSNESINNVLNTDRWNSQFGQSLLSGKLIGASFNRLLTYDNKLVYESDEVINARLESLMKCFKKSTSDDTAQMITNVFETYRKFLLRDVKFQCKMSSATLEKLINYYMIIVCHRKFNDHLSSLIKLFPNYRKISFVFNLLIEPAMENSQRDFVKAYKIQIAQEFIRELLQLEFQKSRSQQCIKNYNLFLQQIIELATINEEVDRNFEKIILCANNMNVISEYYYLAATHLRLQMPKKYNLTIKLMSIGISHDFSYLQELKCSVDSTKDTLEEKYRSTYRRIYLALVTLGCIIKDYALRRLCFQAASLCEEQTTFCATILSFIPELENIDQGDNLDPVLLDVRYLLETFQYDIKDRSKLPEIFEKYSSDSYDRLDYFNHTAALNNDLEPLQYPGVEKYLKRQAIEEKEHISQTSDLDKCLIDIIDFNDELSKRLKKMRNIYTPLRKQKLPSEEQIDLKIKETLSKSAGFKMTAAGEIFYDLSISFDDIIYPSKHWKDIQAKYNELNKDNLFFNFEASSTVLDEETDVNLIYNSGKVDVMNLYSKGYSTYDIENIMLYTILEKKMKFISEEFAYLNKNRNVECDDEQNQVHACFLYLANKPHPEYARLMRLSSTLRRFNHPLEYNLEYNIFDATPGKYKYRQRNKIYKEKVDMPGIRHIENGSADNSMTSYGMEMDLSQLPGTPIEKPIIKRELPIQLIQPTIGKPKKEKIPPAINLAGVQNFNTSLTIQSVFKILQIEIAALLQKEVFIDISKICDISSPHLVQCTSEMNSILPLKIQTIRNGNLSPKELEREIKLPISVCGKLAVVLEFRDEVKYDEYFENPFIASSLHHRVMSNLVVEHVTHNAKCDIDFIVGGDVSKIKVSFQGHKNYRPRKKVQKPDINPTADQHVSVIQQSQKIDLPQQQANSNNISSNIEMNLNTNSHNPPLLQDPTHNGINYTNVPALHQAPYTYPINNSNVITSIGPTNQYNTQVSQYTATVAPQYSQTCYAQSNDNISTIQHIPSSVIQVPQQYTNGAVSCQQEINPFPRQIKNESLPVLQGQESYICNSSSILSPNLVKPKVEILAIEDVSPVKVEMKKQPLSHPKISFSNPCIITKDEPIKIEPSIAFMTLEKPVKQDIKIDDELVDFEDEIQTTMVASTQPKKLVEARSASNIALPKSPPPLHYPLNNSESIQPNTQASKELNNFPNKITSPIQPTIRTAPTRPNVIKSPTLGRISPVKQSRNDPMPLEKIDLSKNISAILQKSKNALLEKRSITAEVIDLTEDISEPGIDLTSDLFEDGVKTKKTKKPIPDITFIECDTNLSSEDEVFKRESLERARKKILKRSSTNERALKCKVFLVDVMKDINLNFLKKDNQIRLEKISVAPSVEQLTDKIHLRNTVAVEIPREECLQETFVENAYDATFTIVCHNSVSYIFNDSYGDGIASVIDSYSKNKTNNNCINTAKCSNSAKNNNINTVENKLKVLNFINNNINEGISNSFNKNNIDILTTLNVIKNIYFQKSNYSDKNHLNFTKNLKNRKKFTKWTPKECNLSIENEKKQNKSIFADEKNHKSLLYRMSYAIMNSIPGLKSMEFFKIPASPYRKLQVEVIHLKEIKSTASIETSDVNDGVGNEPGNSLQTDGNNIESIANSTTIHIQKIGQTSISHETESRTLQTSFGSIIKNTYPPATSRVVINNSDILKTEKIMKLKQDDSSIKKISIAADSSMKNASNVKIMACSSQQVTDSAKNVNKNQTLINMLTQQVMVPTNSNRHYIITSAAKSSETITGTSCTINPNNSINTTVRKAVSNSTGQSQLVQILNSPPTNFTMKSLNMLSTSNSSSTKPNQIMTVSTPPNDLKAELPDSIKQQGVVQFICKTDGKIIHLTPICNSNSGAGLTKKITYKVDTSGAKGPTILHHANQQIILNNQLRKEENPNILTIIQKQVGDNDKKPKNTLVGIAQNSTPSSPIGTRSVYEETYTKFIQTPSIGISSSSASDMGLLTISSTPVNSNVSGTTTNTFIQKIGKTVIQSSNQILPKFNQAFGKSIFSSATLHEQTKVTTAKESTVINRSVVNTISPIKVTKNEKNEIGIVETQNVEKSLPTMQSTLQGNNLLYARPIGNGKLIASNNNVLLTALRSNSNQTNNVRIITTIADSMSNTNRTIMTPVRISVPIQIPQLINSVRPQSPGNFRPQIVIAPAATTAARPQSNIQNLNQSGSKLQSLLMGSQQTTTNVINHQQDQAVDTENNKTKVEQKQKKTVDNSTLEQLREFDMVLEQVLERSSVTPNSVASPSLDTSNNSSPQKPNYDGKIKIDMKSSSGSIASNSPSDSPTSSKSLSSVKVTPKIQEDEHTAQRILDILANYKEQVRNSPDLNNKPAPRRRANPPTNPPAKRKKITASTSTGNIKNSKQFGSSSDVMTDTMGSEDSSCGVGSGVASTGSINNSPRGDIDDQTDISMDNNFYMEDAKRELAQSPQSSNSSATTSPAHNKFSVNRKSIVIESKNTSGSDSISTKSFILNNSQSSASNASSITRASLVGESVERLSSQSSTTAVLMPGNYILPMNVLKGGQQLAILSSNNGQKIIAVPANQLTSSVNINNSSGTSIILQRYVNQMNEARGFRDKTVLTQNVENNAKTLQFHQQNNIVIESNKKTVGANVDMKTSNEDVKQIKQENDHINSYSYNSNNNFVSDKTLITEIIQQQQQLSNHPQHNFMIKLNEPSDPKSSSSIMYIGGAGSSLSFSKGSETSTMKIKNEKLDYDDCIKEKIMDLNNENEILNSPMLITKMEVDENTSSNHNTIDVDNSSPQKMPQFPSILSSCLTKQSNNSSNNVKSTKGFLIDPSSKILMYNDRKQATSFSNNIDKIEIFNQKSFSEECADLGVDEPIASDLFPEADLLFDSGSPKFDHINTNDGNIQSKRELENGEVLLQMNYNNNISEPWLNFDTEDELVDDSQGESSDDLKEHNNSSNNF